MIGRGTDDGQEGVAQAAQKLLAHDAWLPPGLQGAGQRGQGPAGAPGDQRFQQIVERFAVREHVTQGRHLVERREGVAGRAAPLAQHVGHGLVVDVDARVGHHMANVALEVGRRDQPELELLGPAADGGQHPLGIGGGEHEGDVRGRLFQAS